MNAPTTDLRVRQLTIEDGEAIAMWRYPGAWAVYDALEPPRPDEGYWAVVDSADDLVGFCCLGSAARLPGQPEDPTLLDVAIGMRPDLVGHGLGPALGRAAVAYARSVAPDRRLRTTLPEWNAAGIAVAEQAGFTRSGDYEMDRRRFVVLTAS